MRLLPGPAARIAAALLSFVLATVLFADRSTAARTSAAAQSTAAAAPRGCNNPFFADARPNKDNHRTWIPGTGYRSYSVGIASYLRRCGGWVFARHQVYVDTRWLPYGHEVMLQISTRRSDGRWARAHRAAFLVLKGTREIQEVIVRQRRGIANGRLSITEVHVRHCPCSLGSGALPISSTLKGSYGPYAGPEASPRS